MIPPPHFTGGLGLTNPSDHDSVSQKHGLPVQPARQIVTWHSQQHQSIDHSSMFGSMWSLLRHPGYAYRSMLNIQDGE